MMHLIYVYINYITNAMLVSPNRLMKVVSDGCTSLVVQRE